MISRAMDAMVDLREKTALVSPIFVGRK